MKTRSNRFATKKLKLRKPILLAQLPYDKKEARKNMNLAYYIAQSQNIKDTNYILGEKMRLGTPRWYYVTKVLEKYKRQGFYWKSPTAKILYGIYQKNCAMAKGEIPFERTRNILPIVARQETLFLAYKRVKRNRGAMAKAEVPDGNSLESYTPLQKELAYRKRYLPDGISLADFDLTAFLILKGLYPWGSSRRIWLNKPGSDKKRAITIPPFMDRVVQEAIKMVLQAIWEPYFEVQNRSFGFRPNKSCGDALAAITSVKSQGLFNAIEGDISQAYDKVGKKKMISQLANKIEDKAFMHFMIKRLNYDYIDDSGRQRPVTGIPQGGTDSPYLFNIHLHDLDQFIHNELQADVDRLNSRLPNKGEVRYKPRRRGDAKIGYLKKELDRTRERLKSGYLSLNEIMVTRARRYDIMRQVRSRSMKLLRMPYADPCGRTLRIFYVRYADDWILLTNADRQICERWKFLIKDFLLDKLGATLSVEKTAITDIRENPGHFLGFELRRHRRGRLMYAVKGKRLRLTRSPGLLVYAYPDRQRIISRLHSKGFSEKDGFPKDVPWLSNLETFVIIERFNASIRGFVQYYAGFVNKSSLYRWVYILRFSCLKTIAKKYGSSINKVFKRFGVNLSSSRDKTISVTVDVTVNGVTYEKNWSLLTFEQAHTAALGIGLRKNLESRFWEIENHKKIGGYSLKPSAPTVTHENFVDYVSWVSLRAQAPFAMPCCICGYTGPIEMHHIKHIRKTAYKKFKNRSFLQVMSLRNRKQIPVCKNCHINVIHGGRYTGPCLNNLISIDQKLIDNRILHVESFVQPGDERFGKTMEEKGFSVKHLPKNLKLDYEE